jgi:endonuclease-3
MKVKAASKTVQDRIDRVKRILPVLLKTYPDAKCSLNYKTPLELLVATILSAQCTDLRVNIVTRDLFKKYTSAKAYANAPEGALEREIQSTGFYRNKAKSIRAMAASLIEQHAGEVPNSMEELVALAGVGRKTANVVLGNAFSTDVGVVVDTHVGRLSLRLGLTKQIDPVKVELDLMQCVPKTHWTIWSHLMIHHGRAICVARNPKCEQCQIFKDCPTGPKILAERAKAGK